MENQVEFEIPFNDRDEMTQLVEFFRPIAVPNIRERERTATKSLDNLIYILVTIGVEWAAGRYILNPLADRAEEWWQAVSSLQKPDSTIPSKKLSIVIRFDDFDINMTETSDPKTLKRVIKFLKQANKTRQNALQQGVSLRKIRIIFDGTEDILAFGYEANLPTHTIDLERQTIKKINPASPTGENKDIDLAIFRLQTLVRSLDYQKMLREIGYDVPRGRISELEHEIEKTKRNLHH